MKEKIECKNTKLSFYSEGSMTEFTSPVGEYFKNFPFEKYDFENVSIHPDKLSTLIDGLNRYFKSVKPQFQFPTGIVFYPHEISMDENRKDQLRNGLIPVYVLFSDPYIPNSKGEFSWEDLNF
jgi:hypothetical protein